MEENKILEILKKVPLGTKLYSPAFGKMEYEGTCKCDNEQRIFLVNKEAITVTLLTNGKYRECGEVMLFPSDKMRNWDKFGWKKGDVLVNSKGKFCIFKGFSSYPYTTFVAAFANSVSIVVGLTIEMTQEWDKASSNNARKYIEHINIGLGKENRRLNLETLEVEKIEFNDGDILTCPSNSTFILKECRICGYFYYAAITYNGELCISSGNTWCGRDAVVRCATEEEKAKLFDALAKEDKRWNAEKKIIEDIKQTPKKSNPKYKKVSDKPEHEFEPFEKVLVRDRETDKWVVGLYGSKRKVGRYNYVCVGSLSVYCIPYEGNEHLLDTTDNPED